MKKIFVRILSLVLILFLVTPVVCAERWWDPLAVERQVYTYLTEELKLNSAAACGILANIEYESAFQVTNVGDQGTSFGLCQWHNERYVALRGFCMARGLDYKSVEGQMAYLQYELKTSYSALYGALRAVENTPDGAYTAGYLWCVRFERPKDMAQKGIIRGNRAKYKYWNRYNSLSVLSPEVDGPNLEEMKEEIQQEDSVHITLPENGQTSEKTENGRRYVAPRLKSPSYVPYHKAASRPMMSGGNGANGMSMGILFAPLGDGRKYGFQLPEPENAEEEGPEFAEKK